MGTTHQTHTSHNRFKVVKIESKEPFKRGKWICMDFYDQPSHAEVTSEEPTTTSSNTGSSTVAIDNKIEQAMDLVKSHLMFAVREEVDVLKEKITELMDKISRLETENTILRCNATPETLALLNLNKHHHNQNHLTKNSSVPQQPQQQQQQQQQQHHHHHHHHQPGPQQNLTHQEPSVLSSQVATPSHQSAHQSASDASDNG